MSGRHQRSLCRASSPARSLRQTLLVLAALSRPASGARLRPDARPAVLTALNQTESSRAASRLGGALRTGGVKCGTTAHADSRSSESRRCPQECPLWAETHRDDYHCDFQCVGASVSACMAVSPHAPIPDQRLGICRSCTVPGCLRCARDGTDTCSECGPAHTLAGGRCVSNYTHAFYATLATVGVLVAILLWWVVHLVRRPIANEVGLRRGLASRSRAKLLKAASARAKQDEKCRSISEQEGTGPQEGAEKQEEGAARRRRWPLTTNLLRESVAGPGLMAHFNFQLAVIVWAAAVAAGWALLSAGTDWELLSLGTEEPATPRQSCIIVARGYETQHRLMWAKVCFVFGTYVASSLLAIALGIRQLRNFQAEDVRESTHKDFCARCSGLPRLAGTERVEEELRQAIEAATGQRVVGASVCWDFQEEKWAVMSCLEEELRLRDASLTPRLVSGRGTPASDDAVEAPTPGCLHRFFSNIEQGFFSPPVQRVITKGRSGGQRDLRRTHLGRDHKNLGSMSEQDFKKLHELDPEEVLNKLQTSDTAFVVFEGEEARNAAVRAAADGDGLQFRGCTLHLKAASVEPNSLVWQNWEYPNTRVKAFRICVGMGSLFLALLVWVGAFYLPYAMYAVSFNYKYGMEPHFLSSLIFSMVVVAGNAVMYVVCGEISNYISFRTIDSREVCYMMLYTFACVMNVIFDLVVTYLVAYRMMVGINMHTYDGKPLAEVHTFMERFETYAMQRELGEALWSYAFPSTFLLPFLLEPIFTIYLPFQIARLIVRSDKTFDGAFAETFLESTNMDLSRYGDIMLNVILAVLIFFFPGGYTVQTFAALVLSHVFIYAYDSFRALRCVQTFHFADIHVDWWAQWMLSLPCGLLLACAVLKANCEDSQHCLPGEQLIGLCVAAFLLHVALHTIALVYFVPLFGLREMPPTKQSYRECGERLASSFFTANPIFCLRSKYVYEHEPPCDFCVPGKEHLMRINHDIGQHFQDAAANVEDYDVSVRQLTRDFTEKFSQSVKRLARSASGS